MKLCVFPNDPIKSYYEKGEIKERYFNPENIFNEIHIISPSSSDVNEKDVKEIAGDATLKIHTIGELSLSNYKSKIKTVKEIVKKIKPDIIRSYNPILQGWLAVKTSKEIGIPCVVSVHNNYDKDVRDFSLKSKKYSKYLKLWYTSKFVEPYVLTNCSKVICAYRTIIPYVKRLGAKNIEVIYNRVNLSRFSPDIAPQLHYDVPAIIYVARLDSEKNQECLVHAVKDIDVKLLLIGDGPDYKKLFDLTKKLKIEKKVEFVKSVPNEDLGKYYNSAKIFAAPIKQSGVSIPMLEAMACGLPVIATIRDENQKEDIDDSVILVKNEPDEFKKAILNLLENKKIHEEMSKKGLEKVKILDGSIMEKKESTVYQDLLEIKKYE